MKENLYPGNCVIPCLDLDTESAVLLRGPSGTGKSDLTLRVIEAGGQLVSDDQVVLDVEEGQLYATAPRNIKGMIEIRGIGVVRMPTCEKAVIRMVVDLVEDSGEVDRMPEPEEEEILGVSLPVFKLPAFEISAPSKLVYMMRTVLQPDLLLQ